MKNKSESIQVMLGIITVAVSLTVVSGICLAIARSGSNQAETPTEETAVDRTEAEGVRLVAPGSSQPRTGTGIPSHSTEIRMGDYSNPPTMNSSIDYYSSPSRNTPLPTSASNRYSSLHPLSRRTSSTSSEFNNFSSFNREPSPDLASDRSNIVPESNFNTIDSFGDRNDRQRNSFDDEF